MKSFAQKVEEKRKRLEAERLIAEEKEYQIEMLSALHKANEGFSEEALSNLKKKAVINENIFETLMECVKYCSLGQISNALFDVGGQYRRNM